MVLYEKDIPFHGSKQENSFERTLLPRCCTQTPRAAKQKMSSTSAVRALNVDADDTINSKRRE